MSLTESRPATVAPAALAERKNVVLRHPKALIALTLVLAAGGTGAWAITRGGDANTAVTRSITATISSQTIEQTVSASGTINAANVADLTFPVSGTVTKVKATVGQTVTKGQVLARVGTADLQRALDIAQANVDSAQAQVDAASGDTQLTAARAQLATTKDKLAAAKDDLAAAAMVSPIDGTVSAVNIVLGDVVGSGGGSQGGGSSSSAQISVVGTTAYVVDAAVSGSDLSSVKVGQQARITPSGATQQVFGTVSSVGVVASSSSGSSTFPVTIKVTGTPTGLHPGGSAAVTIVTKSLPDVLTVPTAALRQENGKTVVTKADGSTVEVTVGESYGANTAVVSGLSDGDQVRVTTITRPAGQTGNRTGNTNRGTFGGNFTGGNFPARGAFPAGGTFTDRAATAGGAR